MLVDELANLTGEVLANTFAGHRCWGNGDDPARQV